MGKKPPKRDLDDPVESESTAKKSHCTVEEGRVWSKQGRGYHGHLYQLKKETCRFFLMGKCDKGDDCHFAHKKSGPVLCKFWQDGGCKTGVKCQLAHNLEELDIMKEDPEASLREMRLKKNGHQPLYPHVPCKFFLKGRCKDEDGCKFAHVSAEEAQHLALIEAAAQAGSSQAQYLLGVAGHSGTNRDQFMKALEEAGPSRDQFLKALEEAGQTGLVQAQGLAHEQSTQGQDLDYWTGQSESSQDHMVNSMYQEMYHDNQLGLSQMSTFRTTSSGALCLD